MPWTVTLSVRDVNGGPIEGTELTKSTWAGYTVTQDPPITIAPDHVFTADDQVRNITCELQHRRFAPLTMNLVREPSESLWRWSNQNRLVTTAGKSVTIEAVMGRIRGPPTRYIPEADLKRRATMAKQPEDEKVQRFNAEHPKLKPKPPPEGVPIPDNPRALLVTEDHDFRFPAQRSLANFRVLEPDLLADEKETGWKKFKFSTHNVDLARESDLYVIEYGEVGSARAAGPRFFAGVWVPKIAAQVGTREMDFLLWLTPNTRAPFYPQDRYPYTQDYPYKAFAYGKPPDYVAGQHYCALPLHHLYTQHFLSYQVLAARRAPVIVIPAAPAARFDVFITRPTLMRFLKELCLWIPRSDQSGLPKIQPPRPIVRRVGAAGFSAAGVHLQTLLDSVSPFADYRDPIWSSSAAEFDRAWGELWVMDGFFHGLKNVSRFVDKCAAWVLNGSRRLRFYKVDRTDGHWDPRNETGPFGRLVRSGRFNELGKGPLWALSAADAGARWHIASFGDQYLTGPAGTTDVPALVPNEPHEMVPRLMVGHAATTSDFARA